MTRTQNQGGRHRHRRWPNLLLAVTSFAVAVLLAEVALRSLGVADPRVPTYFRRPHEVFGWALEAGASYVNPLPEAKVHVNINSQGWRDLERQLAKPAGSFRIAVLGDSFMEAYSVDFEASFPQRLQALLSASGADTEVLDFGVAGFGTLQEYLAYHHEARRYQPDLVLLGFCVANDLRNNSPVLEAKLGEDKFKLRSRPFLESAQPWRINELDTAAIERQYRRAVSQRSRWWRSVYDRSSLLQGLRLAAAGWLREQDSEPGGSELALYGVHYCEEPPEYTAAWDTTQQILRRLRDEVRVAGSELVVFSVPARREANAKYREAIRRSSSKPDQLCLDEAPGFARLASTLADLDIGYVDLLPEFRARAEIEVLFRNSDRHWNDLGHALAARQVRDALVSQGVVPIRRPVPE